MKQCLVVDDSRVIRKIACRIFEELNFEAEEAENGHVALEICRQHMPDLILLDGNMPNLNGVEFLRTLRREPHGKKPVIVFCTTENDVPQITAALGAGANDHMTKPFDREVIKNKLADIGLVA